MSTTIVQEIIQREVDYTQLQIKKLTPYLDDIQQPTQAKNRTKSLTNRYRAFAWYLVFNNFNKADAWKRAKYGRYNAKTNELELIIPEKIRKGKNFSISMATNANLLFKKTYIQQCIKLIQDNYCDNLLLEHRQKYIEQLQVRAYYDPSIFYNENGSLKPLDQIPDKYRCCIDGIERKRYGKDGDYLETTYSLANRDKARQELAKLTPQYNVPERFELLHKTIDRDNNEVGISLDRPVSELTDEQLQEILGRIE